MHAMTRLCYSGSRGSDWSSTGPDSYPQVHGPCCRLSDCCFELLSVDYALHVLLAPAIVQKWQPQEARHLLTVELLLPLLGMCS